MKRFRTIFESAVTPPSENDLWLKKGELLYYSNEGWKNILGNADIDLSDYYTSEEVDSLLSLTKTEINNNIEQGLNLVYQTINTKQDKLNGTGYVKANGTSISYDNRTFAIGNSSGVANKATTLSIVNISNFKTFNPATLNMSVGDIRIFLASNATGKPWGSGSSWSGIIFYVQEGYWKYQATSSIFNDGIAVGYYRSSKGFQGWKYSAFLSDTAVSWNGGSPYELTVKALNINGTSGSFLAPSSWSGNYPLNIWCPINAGTAGQVLTSSGEGIAPVWKDLIDIPAAESAKKLSTPRLIWGQSFDGTANVDGAFTMNMNIGSHAMMLNIPTEANIMNVNSGSYTIAANSIHTIDISSISSTFSRGWRYMDKGTSSGRYAFGIYGRGGGIEYFFYGGNYSNPLLKINQNTAAPRAILSGTIVTNGFATPTGTSSQFLKANGSVDSNTYITSGNLISALDDYVPNTTTINNKPLTNNINLAPADLGIQQKNININGSSKTVYAPNTEAIGTIYAPTSAGNAGQVLKSNGSGVPVWANFSEAEYGTEMTFSFGTDNGGTIYTPGHEPVRLPNDGSVSNIPFFDRAPVVVSFASRSQCRGLELALQFPITEKFVLYRMSTTRADNINNGVMVQYDYTASMGTTYPTLAGIIFYPSNGCYYTLKYNPTK